MMKRILPLTLIATLCFTTHLARAQTSVLCLPLSARHPRRPHRFPNRDSRQRPAHRLRPLRQAPVVHVRVLYHVGSKDEKPDRQGFAHMFEHMMFRGRPTSKPEQHMQLINGVGGISNAFTSFDQTTYVNTIPREATEMALWLEADRMASFKVTDQIYQIERKVVAQEWAMRMNQPYGNLYEEFLKQAYAKHSYRWTPIGNMEHLKAAAVDELQDFFNTYYIPNNAILVVAGDIDIERRSSGCTTTSPGFPRAPRRRASPARA